MRQHAVRRKRTTNERLGYRICAILILCITPAALRDLATLIYAPMLEIALLKSICDVFSVLKATHASTFSYQKQRKIPAIHDDRSASRGRDLSDNDADYYWVAFQC